MENLKQLLIESGLTTHEAIVTLNASDGSRLLEQLVHSGAVDDAKLTQCISEHLMIRVADAEMVDKPQQSAVKMLDADVVSEHRVLPLKLSAERTLTLAMGDPTNEATLSEIAFFCGCRIERVAIPQRLLASGLALHYGVATALVDAPSTAPKKAKKKISTQVRVESQSYASIEEAVSSADPELSVSVADPNWKPSIENLGRELQSATVMREAISNLIRYFHRGGVEAKFFSLSNGSAVCNADSSVVIPVEQSALLQSLLSGEITATRSDPADALGKVFASGNLIGTFARDNRKLAGFLVVAARKVDEVHMAEIHDLMITTFEALAPAG